MGIMIWNRRKTTRRKQGEALGEGLERRQFSGKTGVIDRKGLPGWTQEAFTVEQKAGLSPRDSGRQCYVGCNKSWEDRGEWG